MNTDSRLERALEVFLDCQERGVPQQDATEKHPELAELLGLLFAGEAEPGSADAREAKGDTAQDFGDYRIRREIGRGGMGVVFEASQRSLGRRVALKVLSQGVAFNPAQVTRFRREALTLARLDHPHIVRILDVGITKDQHWLAMEYVDGQTLERRLQDLRDTGGHQGASLRQMVEIIAAIADALQHVHEAGILHRDVKPSNVLLRSDDQALLSDFGLAREGSAPSMTQTGVIAGTPHYMSPEHLAGGDALLPASDVFSLGVTLYECITLRRPFDGGSNEVVLQQILQHDPLDPRKLHKGLNADLAAITLKALEKDPTRRYQSAAAFAADLRAFLELRPVQARMPSSLQRLRRWTRREPWRAALAVVLLALGVGGIWLATQLPEMRAATAAKTDKEFQQAIALGWLQRTSEHGDDSLAAFRRALALRPRSTEAIAGLCMAMRQFDGNAEAFAELDRLAPTADDSELLQRARALMLQAAGRTEESAAIRKSLPPPRTSMGLWFNGTSMFLLAPDDPVSARKALEQLSLAARLAPTPILSLFAQWTIVASRAKDDVALRECQQTLMQLWPSNPFALHYAALALTRSDAARAIELCREARSKGMNPIESRWLEVSLLNATDRVDELLDAMRGALALPWDDKHRGNLIDLFGYHHADADLAAATESWYREAPTSIEARSRMGKLKSLQEDNDGAIELLAGVANERPDDGEAWYDLAVAQTVASRDRETHVSLAKAMALIPDHERAHVRLLDLLGDEGDAVAILAEHRRWSQVQPNNPVGHLALAQALLAASPPAPEEAMNAIATADYLVAGRDPAILDCKAAVHEALGEAAPARRCRAAAQALRAAPAPVVPAAK